MFFGAANRITCSGDSNSESAINPSTASGARFRSTFENDGEVFESLSLI
jgi:hypothetical protein